MSTPRRSRPSTPVSTINSAPVSSSPSTSRTPLAHHHKTADELAAEEAAKLLTPVRLRSTASGSASGSDILENGSARALRHRRLNEVREETEHKKDLEEERSTAASTTSSTGTRAKSQELDDDVLSEGDVIRVSMPDQDDVPESTEASVDGVSDEAQAFSAGLSTGEIFAQQQDGGRDQAASSESESDPDSEDESSTASDSEDDSDGDSETSDTDDESDAEDERMERLLAAAKAAAVAKATAASGNGKEKTVEASGEDDEVVLQFDEDQKSKRQEAPIPDLSVPKLPKAQLAFTEDGRASATTQLPSLDRPGPSKRTMSGRKPELAVAVPELDDRPYERELSKREKAAQPRKATTSELWASIPTPRSDHLPQMKRDYQALALANSLDPKRFMKGGSKSDKIPESFAIGTMVDAPRHLQATTLTKERKYRAGQVVQGLIKDDDTGDYAKRKYGDLQWSKMENGRGKGWKKRTKW